MQNNYINTKKRKEFIMKRIIFIMIAIMFILTSCTTKTLEVTPEVKEDSTLSMLKDGKTTFNYQGYINLKCPQMDSADSVKINNITYTENKNGTLTVHKGGNDTFSPDDITNIEKDAQDKSKYSEYTFSKSDIEVKDKTSTIKLQYLISNVSPDVKKEDIVRTVKMTMTLLNGKGKTIGTKDVEFKLPDNS